MFLKLLTLILIGLKVIEARTVLCDYREYHYGEISIKDPIRVIEDGYTCNGELSKVCGSSKEITSVSDNHKDGKSLKDVIALTFIDQNIAKLPKGLNSFFPRILGLDVKHSFLKTISSEDLQFPDLILLYLGYNQLTSLSADLFSNLPNLEFFGVDNNPIKSVGENLLSSAPKLRIIYFWNTTCFDRYPEGFKSGYQGPERITELENDLSQKCNEANLSINEDDQDDDMADIPGEEQLEYGDELDDEIGDAETSEECVTKFVMTPPVFPPRESPAEMEGDVDDTEKSSGDESEIIS